MKSKKPKMLLFSTLNEDLIACSQKKSPKSLWLCYGDDGYCAGSFVFIRCFMLSVTFPPRPNAALSWHISLPPSCTWLSSEGFLLVFSIYVGLKIDWPQGWLVKQSRRFFHADSLQDPPWFRPGLTACVCEHCGLVVGNVWGPDGGSRKRVCEAGKCVHHKNSVKSKPIPLFTLADLQSIRLTHRHLRTKWSQSQQETRTQTDTLLGVMSRQV